MAIVHKDKLKNELPRDKAKFNDRELKMKRLRKLRYKAQGKELPLTPVEPMIKLDRGGFAVRNAKMKMGDGDWINIEPVFFHHVAHHRVTPPNRDHWDKFVKGMKQSAIEMNKALEPEGRVTMHNYIPVEDIDYIAHLHKTKAFKNELEELGSGHFGNVYAYKDYAIKVIHRPSSRNRDIEVAKEICHLPFVPTMYADIDREVIIYERIEGTTLSKYLGNDTGNSLNIDENTITQFEKQMYEIIRLGWSPDDLHTENIMITNEGKLIFVDLGYFVKHNKDYCNCEEFMRRDRGFRHSCDMTSEAIYIYVRAQKRKHRENAVEEIGNPFMFNELLMSGFETPKEKPEGIMIKEGVGNIKDEMRQFALQGKFAVGSLKAMEGFCAI
ncbi:hypothetical protein AB3N02_22130 [Priestia aryabhattai]|uniref:hypothetical protein n=1 Tax=Priestia aryabhattai TaxID=412384 RepID=UPI0039A2E6F9